MSQKTQYIQILFISLTFALLISLTNSCEKSHQSINRPPDNHPPEIIDITLSADTVNAGTKVKVVAAAIDPDGDSFSYNWKSKTGSIQGERDTVFWNLPADTGGVFFISLEVIDKFGANDLDSVELVVTHQYYSVHGLIYGYSPNGIHPVEGADVTIPLAIINQTTNVNGEFIAQFMQIPNLISFEASHSQYQNKDTTFSFSDLEPIGPYDYKNLNLRLNKLVNYIPLAVGNEWHYNSKKSYFDANYLSGYETIGSEIWRIFDINSDSTSFTLEITFSGYRIVNDSDTTWSGSDTTILNVMRDDSLWTTNSSDYLIPGVSIISIYSLPYYLPYHDNGYSETFVLGDNYNTEHQIDISAEYGVGILTYRSDEFLIPSGTSYIYELTLTAYFIQ